MERKKWTVCHVGDNYSVTSKFKDSVTIDEAREWGRSEEKEKPHHRFVGILGVDLTSAKLKKLRNDPVLLAEYLKSMNAG